ncbi:hypothetical protein [Streptomyces celluloflavus]
MASLTSGPAVSPPALAMRAVPAGVEQHPLTAPHVTALPTLGQKGDLS